MAAALPPVYTVFDAMVLSGANDGDSFQGRSSAQRIATDIFEDDFNTSMDKTYKDLDDDLKMFSSLTAMQGQIRLLPGVKKRIKAFIQWVRDQIRLGKDPANRAFPVADSASLMRRYTTHDKYIKKSATLTDAAKPVMFTNEVKWNDWAPSFRNYLRTIPGRDGVPLSYITRVSEEINPTPNPDFIDDYVAMATLNGEAFVIDSSEVHTLIIKYIAGNNAAEAKVQPHISTTNGRLAWNALVDHYEGVGVHSINILKADDVFDTLYYIGEKKPHMWWDEFERQLTEAFLAYDKKEGRVVYSNEMKLRILIKKIGADFLASTKAGIGIELTRPIITMTYEQALSSFRNEVNRKFPPNLGGSNNPRRSIREFNRTGRGTRGGRSGRGDRSGRGGRGRNIQPKRQREDSKLITLNDGQRIEFHPSFTFSSNVYNKMKDSDKDELRRLRTEYKKNKAETSQRQNQELATISSLQQRIQVLSSQVPNNTGISEISTNTGTTMMGGRNERANQKSGNNA